MSNLTSGAMFLLDDIIVFGLNMYLAGHLDNSKPNPYNADRYCWPGRDDSDGFPNKPCLVGVGIEISWISLIVAQTAFSLCRLMPLVARAVRFLNSREYHEDGYDWGYEGEGSWVAKTLRVNFKNMVLAFADFLLLVVWFIVLVLGTTPDYVMDLDYDGAGLGSNKAPLAVSLVQFFLNLFSLVALQRSITWPASKMAWKYTDRTARATFSYCYQSPMASFKQHARTNTEIPPSDGDTRGTRMATARGLEEGDDVRREWQWMARVRGWVRESRLGGRGEEVERARTGV